MLKYSTANLIFLDLKEYYEKGVTPDQARCVIEDIQDASGTHLNCEPSGKNNNWTVWCPHGNIECLVADIEYELDYLVSLKQDTGTQPQ